MADIFLHFEWSGCSIFKCLSESDPFIIGTTFNHPSSERIWYSSPNRQCDQIWQFFAILAIFLGFWQQFFCPKLPAYKSFDVDILEFKKLVYLLWRQMVIFTKMLAIFPSEHLVTLPTVFSLLYDHPM